MNKKNIETETTFSKFINFPERVNNLTKMLIIVLYIVAVVLIITFAFPPINYVTIPEYPVGEYNEEIDVYLYIGTSPTLRSEDSAKGVGVDLVQSFRATFKKMPRFNATNARYAYSALKSDGLMDYLYETTSTGRTLTATSSTSRTYDSSNPYTDYFMRVRYDLSASEGVEAVKNRVHTLSMKHINLSLEDLSDKNFSTSSENEHLKVGFEFKANSTVEDADEVMIKVNLSDKEANYTLNLQAYIKTKDNELYPIFGLYNYSSKGDFAASNYSKIYDNIDAEEIYVIAKYIPVDGEEVTLYYKDTYDNIKEIYFK